MALGLRGGFDSKHLAAQALCRWRPRSGECLGNTAGLKARNVLGNVPETAWVFVGTN